MAVLLYIVLILLVIGIAADGVRRADRMYQFPFGAMAVFGGFIVPPLFGLLRVHYFPDWAVERYIFMCILCLLMCWLGDSCARGRPRPESEVVVYDSLSWLVGATLLTLAGGVAYVRNRALFQMGFDMSTGVTVAMHFFVILLHYGFIMALVYFLSTKNPYGFVLMCLGSLQYLDRMVFFGARGDTIQFAFIVAGAVWFVLGKALPRVVVLTGIIAASLAIVSVGAYRSVAVTTTGQRDWSKLTEVDPVEEFQKAASEGSSETVSGIYLMAASATDHAFDFGLYHWNALVFNYVPAQVFGAAFKQSLFLPLPNLVEISQMEYGFVPPTGSTVTGMVDCFTSLGYLGCLKFFIIAYVMQRLYRHAIGGNIIAQSIYLYMMSMALESITHDTQWFLSPWVHMTFFWVPFMLYSRWAGQRSLEPIS